MDLAQTETISRWIESVWVDDNGRVYAWYSQEVKGLCPGTSLTVAKLGAARSDDNGLSFVDFGTILEPPSSDINCSSQNGFLAGGNGSPSVHLDKARNYFYIYYNEAGSVSVARMGYGDRDNPAGKAQKFFAGSWQEPGIGGRSTPVIPAAVDWTRANADFFWGPSIHWNTYLNSYVMLLNHSCCTPGFPQEGVYVSFNGDISNPSGWSAPKKIWQGSQIPSTSPAFVSEWYPQVIGSDSAAHETDKVAGNIARFYIAGNSKWEIVFATGANPLSVVTSALPAGTTGVPYSQTLAASGGTPPYTWSMKGGALPAGLTLNLNGSIGGTPTAPGTFNLVAQVTDSAGASASQSLTISIAAGVSIVSASLPAGTVGVVYSQAFAATGGTPPYRWSATAGSLPPGLTLDPSGTIAGTPTGAGTFNLTIQVTDNGGGTASRPFVLAIAPAAQPLKIDSPVALPEGFTGTVYLQALKASGGAVPYSWSMASGTLPPGLQFIASGVITGTPTAPGTYNFTIRVTDAVGASAAQASNLTVAPFPTLADSPALNAASFQPVIAPGSIVSIFGNELASGPQPVSTLPLPTILNGTSVLLNGVPLPLFYVSGTQANAQVPFDAPVGQATIAVKRGAFTSAPRSVTILPVAPGIFAVNQSGAGAGIVAHANNFSLVSPASPARAGEYLAIFCTGLGALQRPVPLGDVPPVPPPQVTAPTAVTIGGVPAVVSFAGAAPGFAGLYQVNVQVAPGTPTGNEQPLQISMNGVLGNTVTVAVR